MDLDALELAARDRLDAAAYDYYAGGADDEITLTENRAAWRRLRFRYRTLRDVTTVSTETRILDIPVSMPVLIAPTAYHRLAVREGEPVTARAAATAGTLMIASTLATVSLEEVAAAAPDAPRWFQIYIHKDRLFTEELAARAVAAGYRALVLTVDLPVLGSRPRDERNRFTLPEGLEMANMKRRVPSVEGSGLAAYASDAMDPGVTFEDIGWLAELSGLPVLVKGLVRGDDASDAIEAGAAGVIVSNHGGRQLDTSVATADALPEVVSAAADRVPVLVDGGIRRGTDVVKAIALGAAGVLIGRPVLWGLATGGGQGLAAVLEGFREELARAMALCGAAGVGEIDRSLVV